MLNAGDSKEKMSNLINAIKINKIKEMALSNTGLVTIAVAFVIVLVSLHLVHKHTAENDANASFSALNTQTSTASDQKSPNFSFAQSPDLKSPAKQTSFKDNKGNASAYTDDQNLQTQITSLKQEVSLLEAQVNKLTLSSINEIKKPYQLLGVRFDADSKQWVADIKSSNTLYSLKAGETFEGWHVLSVDSEGARIE